MFFDMTLMFYFTHIWWFKASPLWIWNMNYNRYTLTQIYHKKSSQGCVESGPTPHVTKVGLIVHTQERKVLTLSHGRKQRHCQLVTEETILGMNKKKRNIVFKRNYYFKKWYYDFIIYITGSNKTEVQLRKKLRLFTYCVVV